MGIKNMRDVDLCRKMYVALYRMKKMDERNLVYIAGTLYIINEEYSYTGKPALVKFI